MRQRRWRVMVGSVGVLAGATLAQAAEPPTQAAQQAQTVGSHAAVPPAFSAVLVAPEQLARQRSVMVQVTAPKMAWVEPAEAAGVAQPGQGHLHYRVDDGPIIDTANPLLTFHALSPGRHTIAVELASNDHRPVGRPIQLLTVTIPAEEAAP